MIRTSRGLVWAALLTMSSGGITGCIAGRSTGVCEGDQDGEIFYLQILNFLPSKVKASVNGREIGFIHAYDSSNHVPGFQDLGYFPQCSDGLITFAAPNLQFQKLEFTLDCMQRYADKCAVEAGLVSIEEEGPPSDWVEYGMRYPGNYADVADRAQCKPLWKYCFRIDDADPVGTPTPTFSFPDGPGPF